MALGAGLVYLYAKFEPVREVIHRLGAGIKAIGAHILNALITPLRVLMKLLAAIPQSLLPDSWSQSISSMNKGLDDFSKQLSQTTANEFKYALSGKLDHSMINTASKSQSEVKIKIESDKPVKLDQVKSDRHTDLQLDTGNMAAFSY